MQLFLRGTLVTLVFLAPEGHARHGEIPNRIPEAAPYDVSEAAFYPPPYEDKWVGVNNPMQCAACHARIFQEWNGSMSLRSCIFHRRHRGLRRNKTPPACKSLTCEEFHPDR